jgi:hypothetical protein
MPKSNSQRRPQPPLLFTKRPAMPPTAALNVSHCCPHGSPPANPHRAVAGTSSILPTLYTSLIGTYCPAPALPRSMLQLLAQSLQPACPGRGLNLPCCSPTATAEIAAIPVVPVVVPTLPAAIPATHSTVTTAHVEVPAVPMSQPWPSMALPHPPTMRRSFKFRSWLSQSMTVARLSPSPH